ncbi:hypothetical protein IMZ48_26200 [Candidatus Bathyarchaeota archaeon]|nr:hypothetical protein [Candidatus Bathyarchaeota archaeon]
MKAKLPCYSDLVPRAQIQTYLRKHTGQLVSKNRIGRWIAAGEIRMIKVPCAGGHKWFTRRAYLESLITRYSA